LTPDEFTWRIASGGHSMPACGDALQPEELTMLVDFVSQRQAAIAEKGQ
jgi:hypothetical protein